MPKILASIVSFSSEFKEKQEIRKAGKKTVGNKIEDALTGKPIDSTDETTNAIAKENPTTEMIEDKDKVEEELNKAQTKGNGKKTPSASLTKAFKSIGKLPKVGSISLLLLIITFILLTITKNKDGQTRINLIFNTLMGQTILEGFQSKNGRSEDAPETMDDLSHIPGQHYNSLYNATPFQVPALSSGKTAEGTSVSIGGYA